MSLIEDAIAQQTQNKPSTLGVILDAIAGLGGMQGGYAAGRTQKRLEQRQTLATLLEQARLEKELAPKPQTPTNTQRTYEYIKSLNPALAETYLNNQAQGAPIAVDSMDEAGNTHREYLRPGALGQGQPAQAPGSDGGTLPPGYSVRKRGGAAPTASVPFPLRPLTR